MNKGELSLALHREKIQTVKDKIAGLNMELERLKREEKDMEFTMESHHSRGRKLGNFMDRGQLPTQKKMIRENDVFGWSPDEHDELLTEYDEENPGPPLESFGLK
jgi:FtsZ-binding cell division protein ZapB